MLKLLIQGGNEKSGMRYSPVEEQEEQKELLDLIVAKLPKYVYEVTDRVVWWRMMSHEAEAIFLNDVNKLLRGNFEIQSGGSSIPENSHVDELEESMEDLRTSIVVDKNEILSELAGEFYKPEKLEWLGDNGKYALVYFPVLQTTRQKEKIYFFSKVVKVELATMEEKVVFDGSTRQRLGKNRRQDLIRRELG